MRTLRFAYKQLNQEYYLMGETMIAKRCALRDVEEHDCAVRDLLNQGY